MIIRYNNKLIFLIKSKCYLTINFSKYKNLKIFSKFKDFLAY